MSFDEWQASQDQEKLFEWGCTSAEPHSLAESHKKPFRDVPEDIRNMFYTGYVSQSVHDQNKPKDSE